MDELDYNIVHLKPKNKKVEILSRHDILKFFQYIIFQSQNRDSDVLLFVLFLTTGSRSSEISNIKLEDISWEDNTLFFPKVKHNKSLTVPLRERLAESIKQYSIKYNIQTDDYLFSLNHAEIRKLFYEYLNKAQLPKVTVHSMRHSFATMMAESGAAITQIQQLLGHADVTTTKGYVHSNLIRNKNIRIKETEEIFRTASKSF
jgi:integrase